MDLKDLLALKDKELSARKPICIRCCTAAGCLSSRGEAVKERLEPEFKML